MPARKKRLIDFVRDGTFLARRHAALLERDPPLRNPVFRRLQEQYCASNDQKERHQIALTIQRAVRDRLEYELLSATVDDVPELSSSVPSDLSGAEVVVGSGATITIKYSDHKKGL